LALRQRGPIVARAQQSGRIPVVGAFWACAYAEAAAASRLALLKGLAELGYVPGKTVTLLERYDTLATELVNLKVDVLVTQAGAPMVAGSLAPSSPWRHRLGLKQVRSMSATPAKSSVTSSPLLVPRMAA